MEKQVSGFLHDIRLLFDVLERIGHIIDTPIKASISTENQSLIY
jgi:hypothetical protein